MFPFAAQLLGDSLKRLHRSLLPAFSRRSLGSAFAPASSLTSFSAVAAFGAPAIVAMLPPKIAGITYKKKRPALHFVQALSVKFYSSLE